MKFLIIGLLIVIILGSMGYYFYKQQKLKSITDFESCAKVYPVMTSFPAQCNTPDGKHFVQELSEEEKRKLVLPSPISTKMEVDPPESTQTASLDENAKFKTYTNPTYKYKVDYPKNYFVKSNYDENVSITDEEGEILTTDTDYNVIHIEPQSERFFSDDEKKMSGYDYMIYRALMLCAADGPQGGIYCSKETKVIPFNNKFGQKVYEIYMKSIEERFIDGKRKVVAEKEVGPLFGLEFKDGGNKDIRLVLIYDQNESLFPTVKNWDFSVLRGMADSFRF